MKESHLTSVLVDTLKEGAIKKIVRIGKRQVGLYREISNYVCIADILVSLHNQGEIGSTFSSAGATFVAIEVKISDWKGGLYQAWRYKSFAEKSYLAIYKPYAHKVDFELFRSHNIGLIAFDDNSFKILVRPAKEKIAPTYYATESRKNIWSNLVSMERVQPAF